MRRLWFIWVLAAACAKDAPAPAPPPAEVYEARGAARAAAGEAGSAELARGEELFAAGRYEEATAEFRAAARRIAETRERERAGQERLFTEALDAKAGARALRTQLNDRRSAVAAMLAAAEGRERDVWLAVHEVVTKEILAGEAVIAADTALERAEALFASQRYADARAAYAEAGAAVEALLLRVDAAEGLARARFSVEDAAAAVERMHEWFDERKLVAPAEPDGALTDALRLLDAGDAGGAVARAADAQAAAEDAMRGGEKVAAGLASARDRRGAAEAALGALERLAAGGAGETDLSRAARAKLAEGDERLGRGDAEGASRAYGEAALAFEQAIEAILAADKARLAELRRKKAPPPLPPDFAQDPRVAVTLQRALDWLARHQDDDGKWDCNAFTKHDPGAERTGGGRAHHDVGVTGLALLAFLGAGHGAGGEGAAGYYAINVGQGLRFLRAAQDDGGVYGGRASIAFIYDHAIATLAMCEALRRSGDPLLRDSAERGVRFLERARNAGLGWRYEPRGGENDTSVTAWCIRALAAARDAGIQVDAEAFPGALAWIGKMTDPTDGRVGYDEPGGPCYRPSDRVHMFTRTEAMTAAGVCVRMICGEDARKSELVRLGLERVLGDLPRWGKGEVDMYCWHFATLAARGAGGAASWHAAILDVGRANQVASAPHAGSWDPKGIWGEDGGRVYATAIMALTLMEAARAR
jgi:hypothetical protein